jgi:hypothetical protein
MRFESSLLAPQRTNFVLFDSKEMAGLNTPDFGLVATIQCYRAVDAAVVIPLAIEPQVTDFVPPVRLEGPAPTNAN